MFTTYFTMNNYILGNRVIKCKSNDIWKDHLIFRSVILLIDDDGIMILLDEDGIIDKYSGIIGIEIKKFCNKRGIHILTRGMNISKMNFVDIIEKTFHVTRCERRKYIREIEIHIKRNEEELRRAKEYRYQSYYICDHVYRMMSKEYDLNVKVNMSREYMHSIMRLVHIDKHISDVCENISIIQDIMGFTDDDMDIIFYND